VGSDVHMGSDITGEWKSVGTLCSTYWTNTTRKSDVKRSTESSGESPAVECYNSRTQGWGSKRERESTAEAKPPRRGTGG
jgi:hypothetical protein